VQSTLTGFLVAVLVLLGVLVGVGDLPLVYEAEGVGVRVGKLVKVGVLMTDGEGRGDQVRDAVGTAGALPGLFISGLSIPNKSTGVGVSAGDLAGE